MKACGTFREIDELFIDYEDKFNDSYGSYNKYCPVKNGVRKCETNYEKLSAISRHAYMELVQNNQVDLESENELSVDFLIMGLSNRLYKISKDHTLSLKDAFGKYLGNSIGSFNHQSILYNKKYYMGYNIGVMNGFYLLFKQICETINISEKPNAQQYEYLNNVTQCHIMYDKLYEFVNRCDPYLQLLVHLKTIYNELIEAVIKLNNNDESLRSNLIKISSIDKTKFEYEFNSVECKKLHKKLAKTTPNIIKLGIQMLKDDEKRKNGEGSQSTEDEDDEDFDLDEEEDDDDFDLDEEEDDDDLQNAPQGTPPVPAPEPQQQPSAQSTSGQHPSTQPISTTSSPGITPPAGTTPSTDIQNGVVNNPNDPKGDTNTQPTSQGDKQVNQNGDSANPDTSQGDSGGGSDSGSSGGSKALGDQAATHSSGTSDGYWSSTLGSRLNPLNYLPSASEIYETQKSILTSASNKISDAYNSAVTTVKNTYNSAVTTVKYTYNSAVANINYAYTTSTNYINGAVSSITSQLSSLGSFSHLGDDQSGSGGSGNSLPTGNNLPSTTQIPKPDPNSPSPSIPQSPSPSITSPPLQIPSQPQSNQTQDSSQDPSSQKQPSSTHDSQDTVQNGASNIVQQPDPNTGAGVQTMAITQVTLPSSGINPSNIGNGYKPSGTDVKINEKPSIWCIGSNKKCDIVGIGIIGISILVFLTIMYKYISFGSAKNSKKKKSMKRVIKYGDGNRKTQIIIKSYDRNKDLKPIINSVVRKKDPTINIYKLMQADPVPFINLFFLLIFFVYKKKLNYLEL
ncbi:PIR protein CIR protein [Plasmodium vinckei petteri]|uniref:PIR protein CIR protein n=1 Tax=Plasmodium vinckei petteri TaxID=138298 RepID=A0A6V7SD63_PLAVN|nr:PIR protein CIR protein [Plasmodium vinckei petteri]